MQRIVFRKWCNFSMHGRRKDVFQGRHQWIFPNVFLGRAKSGEICFLPLETKKTVIFAEIFKFLTPFQHRFLCVGKSPCHTIKSWCNFTRFNTILNREILLNLIRKMKYLTAQFQLCFCFRIGNTKYLYFISALVTQLASLQQTTC